MAQKTLVFDFTLTTEKHQIKIEDCPSSCNTAELKVAELPMFSPSVLACRDVILQLKDTTLVEQPCDNLGLKGIKAKVIERLQLVSSEGCPLSKYRFTVSYDDSQLTNPDVPLLACDVDGIDPFTYSDEYVQKILQCAVDSVTVTYTLAPTGPAEPTSVTLTGSDGNNSTVDLCPLIAGCLPGLNILTLTGDSGTPEQLSIGDTLSIRGVGLVATSVSATDTLNIEITPSGTDGDVLTTVGGTPVWQALPAIVPDSLVDNGNNSLTHIPVNGGAPVTVNFEHSLGWAGGASTALSLIQPNGTPSNIDLCPIVANCPFPYAPDILTDNGNNSFTHTPVNGGAPVTVNFAHGLVASPLSNSSIRLTKADGTFDDLDLCPIIANCPPIAETAISALDTNSIILNASGVANHTLSADLRVDTVTPGNALTVGPNGAYVATTANPTGGATNCISVNVSGANVVTATPVISGAQGGRNNSLACTGSGLFAPEAQFVTSNTCAAGGIGAQYMIRSITDLGNNQFRLNGAPEHTTVNSISLGTSTGPGTIGVGGQNTSPSHTVIINNPNPCRAMRGVISREASVVNMTFRRPNINDSAFVNYRLNIIDAGLGGRNSGDAMHKPNNSGPHTQGRFTYVENTFTIAAGGSFSNTTQARLEHINARDADSTIEHGGVGMYIIALASTV